MIKYYLVVGEYTFGIIWNKKRSIVKIGGKHTNDDKLRELVDMFFPDCGKMHESHPSAGKVTYWFKYEPSGYSLALKLMREHGVYLVLTNSLERVMR